MFKFLKKKANLGRLVHMMKCEEGWCQDAVDQGDFPVAADTSSHKETLIHTMFL